MKRLIMTAVLIGMVSAAFAYGGGGLFSGHHVAYPGYYSIDRGIEYSGGYGYGTDRDGRRSGGFGLVMNSSEQFVGAFGGAIQGHQVRLGPVTLSANIWTGFGYLSPQISGSPISFGFVAEATAEAGFAVLPWLQLSFYGGAQAIGPFDLVHLVDTVNYSPILGTRLTWGSF